jgi:hypothetical protein
LDKTDTIGLVTNTNIHNSDKKNPLSDLEIMKINQKKECTNNLLTTSITKT